MTKDSIQLLTNPKLVSPYIDQITGLADANRKSLGFLQKAVFREQGYRGRLWAAISTQSDKCKGFLLFGGRYPRLRVFQLCVRKSCRNMGIGSSLITALVTWAEAANYSIISALVGADLAANSFWEQLGFELVRQKPGGRSSNRLINIRVRELDTPSLFSGLVHTKGMKNIQFAHRPLIGMQTYVVDLNIFFDITKKRVQRAEAARLIGTGLSQEARVFVTPEFTNELKRNSPQGKNDPILEFARALPALPKIPQDQIDAILADIESLVFPNGIPSGRKSVQSLSDLTHLAYCIHHRVTGFITREKAILAANEQLQEIYLLEILSPSDLLDSITINHRQETRVSAHLGEETVSIGPATESQRSEIDNFLIAHGVTQENLSSVWHPGSSLSPRKRMTARIGQDLIAVASWNSTYNLSRPDVLNIYLDERATRAETVIDHFLEAALRDTKKQQMRVLILVVGVDQTKTRATAAKRGFLKSFPDMSSLGVGQLCKLTFSGIISSDNWTNFRNDFATATGLSLCKRLPTYKEFQNTGILIKNQSDASMYKLSLFEFETLISPGVVMCPGRSGLIVPVQSRFAKGLFSYVHPQLDLFPGPEALLHVEKAYFRNSRRSSQFLPGTLVFFYLSGSGGGTKEIIGCARITYSEIIGIENVELSLQRQGVLSRSELAQIADSNAKVHAFTFDNFNAFTARVPFKFLRGRGMISGANLVTAEKISSKHCTQICEYGFVTGNKLNE